MHFLNELVLEAIVLIHIDIKTRYTFLNEYGMIFRAFAINNLFFSFIYCIYYARLIMYCKLYTLQEHFDLINNSLVTRRDTIYRNRNIIDYIYYNEYIKYQYNKYIVLKLHVIPLQK